MLFSFIKQSDRPTLILTWIPNATLKKNPQSIDSSPAKSRTSTPRISPRRTPKQDFSKSDESPAVGINDSQPVSFLKKRKHNSNSVCSETSTGSKDDVFNTDDSLSNGKCMTEFGSLGTKLSSSCKSQTDSGIGVEPASVQLASSQSSSIVASSFNSDSPQRNGLQDGELQNNEKTLIPLVKPSRVGVHVNDLNGSADENLTSCQEYNNFEAAAVSEDQFTAEEKLIAMLNRNKLHAKVKESDCFVSKPVSIEIKGDNLVVVTQNQNAGLGTNDAGLQLADPNINRNESKFETSSSQSPDLDSISFSSDNLSPCSNMQGEGLPLNSKHKVIKYCIYWNDL